MHTFDTTSNLTTFPVVPALRPTLYSSVSKLSTTQSPSGDDELNSYLLIPVMESIKLLYLVGESTVKDGCIFKSDKGSDK